MAFFQDRVGARMSTNSSAETIEERLTWPLSKAAAEFMLTIQARELDASTEAEYRTALWYLFEFLSCDPPCRELAADTPSKYLDWLRQTPIGPKMTKTRPRTFTAAAVAAMFRWPPRRKTTQGLRVEQTVGKYWRHIAPFFEFLGMDTQLRKRGPGRRPNLDLPPSLVPIKSTIVNWWRDTLTATAMPAKTKRRVPPTASQRRRVLLVQGLVYLTGMRIEEALAALRSDLEGHWLLVRETKTHKPRIIYVSAQALGIAEALHAGGSQRTLFDVGEDRGARKYLAGWGHTESNWHTLVRDCQSPDRHDPREKRHQAMRRKLSTWMHRRDPVSESAQLGHGSGVVFTNYLDYLRPLPKLLERYRLPEVEGFSWPAAKKVKVRRPDRLYAEIRRLVNERD
jgi:integrase